MKCVQTNACPFRAANFPYTSSCPSKNCPNWGPTRAPTAPRLATDVSKNIEETQESAPTLYHAIPPVVFHQYTPALSPNVLPIGYDWPSLTARADTAHAAPELTETAAFDPAAPAAVGSGKRN